MEITPQMVKELREKTGAGMMDCKKALAQTGSMEKAIEYLREKGLSAAAKKADRVASQGLVDVVASDGQATMVEVNCETDFVAKNADFIALTRNLLVQASKSPKHFAKNIVVDGSVFENDPWMANPSLTVQGAINEKVATIGEKLSFRRAAHFSGGSTYGSYIHAGGSIGVMVELKVQDASKANTDTLKTLARDLAMHVAAANPTWVTRSEVTPDFIASERAIFDKQVAEMGKPAPVAAKIVDGKIEKRYSEVCLVEQPYVKDPNLTVSKRIEMAAKEASTTVAVTRFVRFKVGEGVEKKQDDFAAEVARMAGA